MYIAQFLTKKRAKSDIYQAKKTINNTAKIS